MTRGTIGTQPARSFGGGVYGFRAKATNRLLANLHMIVSGKARAPSTILGYDMESCCVGRLHGWCLSGCWGVWVLWGFGLVGWP